MGQAHRRERQGGHVVLVWAWPVALWRGKLAWPTEGRTETIERTAGNEPEHRGGVHMVRVGVDIGGTFTDFAAWREGDREVFTTKVPSTPPRFAEAFKTGFGEVLARMRPASGEPVYVMHGTTVSTYSIIERSGPTIALFTTAGFKDILGLERLRLKQPLDLFGTRPQPLIPRHLVFEIDERLNSDGTVRRPWSTVRGILTADLVSPRESQGATLPRFLAMIQSMGVAPPAEWILW